MHHLRLFLLVCVVTSSLTPAQNPLFIPDANSSVGTVNTFPFGNVDDTYVLRIPASSLDPQRPRIVDVSFAPGGSGTWSASQAIIGFGHIPPGFTCPMTFPQGPSAPGSLRDFVVWNTGPFSWTATQDAWSPLNLDGGPGGDGFAWNGSDDVVFYLSFSGGTLSGGWTGGCHRSSTIPRRTFASGFQASVSTNCDTPDGLKIRVDVRTEGRRICVPDDDPTTGISNLIPFSTTYAPGTYLATIPASSLDPAHRVLYDVGFAPSGSGTWTSADVFIAMGHVMPAPACPYTFPSPANPGVLTDLTVLWDSAVQGPLTWNAVTDTWSRLGLDGGPCGRGFRWDGVSDVGFFMTYQNPTVTGWSGGCHRTNTVPTRTWAATYRANQSAFCEEPLGLKMCVDARAFELGGWQTNQPGSRAFIIGAPQGTPLRPSQVTLGVGQVATARFESTNTFLGWDLVTTSPEPGLPVGGGGIELPDCQIVNIDLAAPSFFSLFGLQFNSPFVNFSLPFSLGSPTRISAQMVNVDPSQLVGVSLSGLTQVKVLAQNLPVPGPTADNGVVAVPLGPTGLAANDIPFFGNLYSRLFVSANGRVTFGSGDPDPTPSVAEALTDQPSIGLWTDLDPSRGGTITVESSGGSLITVRYQNVRYPTGFATATFDIFFNTATGEVGLDGLAGVTPPLGNLQRQWIGISRGNTGAVNAGAVTFLPGTTGAAVNAFNMMFDGFDPASSVGPAAPSLVGGTNRIVFTPNAQGGYDWAAF